MTRTKLIRLIFFMFFALATVNTPAYAGEVDTFIPDSQIYLCNYYGNMYGIQPEVLEALIEVESAGKMSARNNTCYGICQINGAVWGYGYTSESSQIEKACQMLISYNLPIDEALSRYNGQRTYRYKGYVNKVLSRSHTLEVLHYGY